jgi:hypothetical protein
MVDPRATTAAAAPFIPETLSLTLGGPTNMNYEHYTHYAIPFLPLLLLPCFDMAGP